MKNLTKAEQEVVINKCDEITDNGNRLANKINNLFKNGIINKETKQELISEIYNLKESAEIIYVNVEED